MVDIGYQPYKMPVDTCKNCQHYGHEKENSLYAQMLEEYGESGIKNAKDKGYFLGDPPPEYSDQWSCLLGHFILKSSGGICPKHTRKSNGC
jgi:hypothetical protein